MFVILEAGFMEEMYIFVNGDREGNLTQFCHSFKHFYQMVLFTVVDLLPHFEVMPRQICLDSHGTRRDVALVINQTRHQNVWCSNYR